MEYHALLAVFQGLPAILAGMHALRPDIIVIGIPARIFILHQQYPGALIDSILK
jgi:hypothetical protein